MSIFKERLLEGKTAVITGGGSGINLRIAERFAEHGARLVLIGRTQAKLDAAAEAIASRGGDAIGLSADVREFEALDKVFAAAAERFGEVDLLVCGAAGNFPALATGMSAYGFKAVVDIDLLGTFNTCRAAYKHLRKPGASIINISATFAMMPSAYQAHVCAAKAGVDMITRTLAIEWGPTGIRVNSIAPGPIGDTEGMRRLAPTGEVTERLQSGIPLQRYGTKDEIADLALFLSSSAAAYITGAVVVCDGGQSLLGSGGWVEALKTGSAKRK
jgi:NAD(P)-dependent dehydrogenase (short-subunit alcohol dehydrogenase family)